MSSCLVSSLMLVLQDMNIIKSASKGVSKLMFWQLTYACPSKALLHRHTALGRLNPHAAFLKKSLQLKILKAYQVSLRQRSNTSTGGPEKDVSGFEKRSGVRYKMF